MGAFKTSITKTGAFWTADIAKTMARNKKDLMDWIAAEGEKDVRGQLRAGEGSRYPIGSGVKPNRVSAHVRGRTRSIKGKEWKVTAIVSVNNSGFTKKQGIALMAAASWLESQVHAFRRTAGRLRRARPKVDLLKGLR